METAELFEKLVREMVDRNASDMHIRAGHPAMLRIHGDLETSSHDTPLTPEQTRVIAYAMMSDRIRQKFEDRLEVDLSRSVAGVGRFRGNIYHQSSGINIALRIIPSKIPTVDELGLPSVVKKMAENQRGLILVTGTTGCGKSTTLAAIIDHINANRKAHIITIEDPIEFMHTDKKAIISQRELGLDTLSYADALKHVVRQDPDVILLGEMRDQETMAAAITSAQTGHLVLSTVHTIDTVQTISRIVDMFPPHQQQQIRLQLADTLQGVVSQRLLPRSDVPGRVPAVEILVATPLVRKAIEQNDLAAINNAVRQGQYYGMQTFNQALVKIYNDGKVKVADAMAAASNPEELMLAIRGIESGTDAAKFFNSQT